MKQVAQARIFVGRVEALADSTRLRLLRLLDRYELGVVELCDILQLPQSTVSRHLKLLAEQHWVDSRRKGTSNLYRMEAQRLDPTSQRLWKVAREETGRWPSAEQDQLRLTHHLEVRRSRTKTFFAGAANQWDVLRTRLYGERFTLLAMLALLPRSFTVADLGCGTGHVAAQIAPYVRRVIGVDESQAMLAAARQRVLHLPNVELREGPLEGLPIETGSCDAALAVLALTYVADPLLALREIRRVLRPAGRVVIVDLLTHEREDFRREMGQEWLGFSREDLEKDLRRAGLSKPEVVPLRPEPEAKGPALFLATAECGDHGDASQSSTEHDVDGNQMPAKPRKEEENV